MIGIESVSSIMNDVFIAAIKLAGPPLVISMIVGIVISIFQAATQVHEQTITFVPKLIAIGVVLLVTSGHMMQVLTNFTEKIFALL